MSAVREQEEAGVAAIEPQEDQSLSESWVTSPTIQDVYLTGLYPRLGCCAI